MDLIKQQEFPREYFISRSDLIIARKLGAKIECDDKVPSVYLKTWMLPSQRNELVSKGINLPEW